MISMSKKLTALLLLLILLIPGFAGAEKLTKTNEETGYIAVIDDGALLLDAAEYNDVMNTMMGITDYCNVGLYTYHGESRAYVGDKAEEWANKTFTGHCTLFMIDMTTRQIMLWSSSDMRKTITQAKGNILLFSGGSRTNDGEAFPTAPVFNELGYNCFVVNNRMAPYSTQDSDMDTQRAVRMVKSLGEENGWGGMDMIALCGFSAGGWKVINSIENAYITETPDQLGADDYVPDEIDETPALFNVAILVYTGNDEMLKETGYWPALFMVAGSEDSTGATQRLENYYENAKDVVPSELIVYEGAGHGFGSGAEGSMHTTEEASHWPEEADRFMQANLGYNQSNANAATGETENSIDIHTEDSAVTVEYYDGTEIIETQEDGSILVQVPDGQKLDHINIFSSGGAINITGVLADTYDLETVHDDMNVYLPEDTAFHVQLATISDLFESDFLYDVTMQRHEYIFGDYENGVDIHMETIIGTARVMILQ